MDDLRDFCARMLGEGAAADRAAELAGRAGGADRVTALTAAVQACRKVGAEPGPGTAARAATEPDGESELALVDAVARELSQATARLSPGQREALALRERFGLGHSELATATAIEPSAVAPLLARARIRLRSELRGAPPPPVECSERDRALRTIALRQDHEEVLRADEDWLLDHLGHCAGCGQAHAAMLEASVCYRAWRLAEPGPDPKVGASPTQ
jgi:hypothetical protein